MNVLYSTFLKGHAISAVQQDALSTQNHLARHLRERLSAHPSVAVYAVGSLARGEYGPRSDVDLFSLSELPLSSEAQSDLSRAIQEASASAGTSLDTKHFAHFTVSDLLTAAGTPADETSNSFTARVLLILEGVSVFNEALYRRSSQQVISFYLSRDDDERGRYFLINDILRYWKLLCVTTEVKARSPGAGSAGKVANLRFARALTVFATILNLSSGRDEALRRRAIEQHQTPLVRLAQFLDSTAGADRLHEFEKVLDYYLEFLELKSRSHWAHTLESDQRLFVELDRKGDEFARFLYSLVQLCPEDFARRLVI